MAKELRGDVSAEEALRRVQDFDTNTLVREAELGSKFALHEVVEPAQRVIELFKLLSSSQLYFFPQRQRDVVRDQANAFYNLLEQCRSFEVEGAQPSPTEAKNALVNQLDGQFQPIFDQLYPLISFATARSQDFSELERQARSAAQSARDLAASVVEELQDQKKTAGSILEEVRAVAAEQGVNKQAIHFKMEADKHITESEKWRKNTIWLAIILSTYSIGSLFFHHIPGLDPNTQYHSIQLSVSKFLIFVVIGYLLFLCARNFLAHKHNEIVNRHRQNALSTFTALVEATSDAASSDIVLSHAAACIFSPQETGYTKHESVRGDSVPSFQLIPRIGNMASN